jgi:hypothetical protein
LWSGATGASQGTEMSPVDVPTFAVCAFDRVFDVQPKQEFLTLPELTRLLRRFELKPKVRDQAERDVRRVDKAWAGFEQGKEVAGPIWPKLRKAAKKAEDAGEDPAAAAQQRYQYLRAEAVRGAKKDFRLWAPSLYKPASRRGSENVVYLSCLVLDYDDGTPLRDASETWEAWFHIVHTTWSHTEAHNKFRVVVPLAQPVPAKLWRQVWHWAEDFVGRVIDPACKGEGHAFALPVVPDQAHPREAFSTPGPLLDPVLEGIVESSAERRYWPVDLDEPLLVGSRKHHYFLHEPDGGSAVVLTEPASWVEAVDAVTIAPVSQAPMRTLSGDEGDPWESKGVWDDFEPSPVADPPQPTAAPRTPVEDAPVAKPREASSSSDAAGIELLVGRMERALERIEQGKPSGIVDQLERLARLRETGLLTESEFNRAKTRLLEGT